MLKKTTRKREQFDTELALTHDLLATAHRLCRESDWRVATRALYYVLMRIADNRGRRQLAEFLTDSSVGW